MRTKKRQKIIKIPTDISEKTACRNCYFFVKMVVAPHEFRTILQKMIPVEGFFKKQHVEVLKIYRPQNDVWGFS